MKQTEQTERSPCLRFSRRALLWPLLLTAGFLFAQFYQNPISHIAFWGILFLPLLPALQIFLSVLSLKISFFSETDMTEKGKPVACRLQIKNRGPFPIPFVRGQLLLPDDSGASVEAEAFLTALPPFSEKKIERQVLFAYRGSYPVGLGSLALSDSLRLVSYYPRRETLSKISVLPRRIAFPGGEFGSGKQKETTAMFVPGAVDTVPTSNTRLYQPGDRPQMIHWKLSSKTDELLVREERPLTGRTVALFCDFPSADEEDDKELLPAFSEHGKQIASDRVAELALSALGEFLDGEETFLLVYPDGGLVKTLPVTSESEFCEAFSTFGLAELPPKRVPLAGLIAAASEREGLLPIFVMSEIGTQTLSEIKEAAALLDTDLRPTLLFAADLSPFGDPERRRQENEPVLADLTEAGFAAVDLTDTFSRQADR